MSVFAGRSADGAGWYKVYEWTTFNDVPTFAYDINNSAAAPAFTRILYQFVFGTYSVWCEMDDFTGGLANRTGVPLSWTHNVAVNNLSVYYSTNATSYPNTLVASIYNRTAATGKINFWPSDYGPSADTIYDDVDENFSTNNGFGSMQVSRSDPSGRGLIWIDIATCPALPEMRLAASITSRPSACSLSTGKR